MENYLDSVIQKKIALLGGSADRYDALQDIKRSIDEMGLYDFAKMFRVMDENASAEEFAVQYYTAYNNEVRPGTY